MLFDSTADLSPAPPREGKLAKTILPVKTKIANGITAAKLGICRISIAHQRRDMRGDVIHRIGDNSEIPLSGGDGADFSRWWTVTCRPALEPLQCRSPDGCHARRLDGHSYCPKHRARYTVPMLGSRAPAVPINVKRKRQPPRLDLLKDAR